VQIDDDEKSGRLRMTTHHVFHKLIPDLAAIIGAQLCAVVQPARDGRFVRVMTKLAPETFGFVFIAK